ncbi:MAG: CHAT domain-containing protein [Cyanobacteria bacterium SBC]|nr:CHAT domain-containing protein [Cyanobacteria bacterium SBC]
MAYRTRSNRRSLHLKGDWERRSASLDRASGYFCTIDIGCVYHKTTQMSKAWVNLSITLWIGWGLLEPAFSRSPYPPISSLPPFIASSPHLDSIASGQEHYDAGRFADAARVWETAAQNYDRAGDRLNAALSNTYLSLAYQHLGHWESARNALDRAQTLLVPNPSTATEFQVWGITLNAQGQWEFNQGQIEAALETWQAAERAYRQSGDESGWLGSQINQAQALQTLGLYRRAQSLLEQVTQQLADWPDSSLKAQGLRSLGMVRHAMGSLHQAQIVLEQSLAVAQTIGDEAGVRSALLSLSNTARDFGDTATALDAYQWVAQHSQGIERLEVRLNQLSLLVMMERTEAARSLLPEINELFDTLTPSRRLVYSRVNFAKSFVELFPTDLAISSDILARAVAEARSIDDLRAESYSLGQLGHLYERVGQFADAQALTEQALTLAQTISASDLLARWQWQLGRVLSQQQQYDSAIAAYREAVTSLEGLRRDVAAFEAGLRFSFRDRVEPVYRELVSLLLRDENLNDPEQRQARLAEARQTIEQLQLAELDNFFREACLDAESVSIDQIDPHAAAIYPILLPDRLFVILSVAGEPLDFYWIPISQAEVEATAEQMLQSLHLAYSDVDRLQIAQTLYGWLLRPAETALERNNIETLVFVLDGILRNVPMSALHDGKHYLVEQYAVALSPSLYLFAPKASLSATPQVLSAGLTEAHRGFAPLPGVADEIERIAERLPTRVLLDDDFTRGSLDIQIRSNHFEIVHLATHGQFSSNVEETFLLAWDGPIEVRDLEAWLQANHFGNTIDLLVLSACQTALGDDRAVLGMAGVALRSGARSTIATLWSVRDRSTTLLMDEFYRQLVQTPRPTKAEALRRAQLHLLYDTEYNHPFFWSSFVSIGNWL